MKLSLLKIVELKSIHLLRYCTVTFSAIIIFLLSLQCHYSPVVYGCGNFAIALDPNFFHKLNIQSISENLKLWTLISNLNPKPPTQLHIGQNIW